MSDSLVSCEVLRRLQSAVTNTAPTLIWRHEYIVHHNSIRLKFDRH